MVGSFFSFFQLHEPVCFNSDRLFLAGSLPKPCFEYPTRSSCASQPARPRESSLSLIISCFLLYVSWRVAVPLIFFLVEQFSWMDLGPDSPPLLLFRSCPLVAPPKGKAAPKWPVGWKVFFNLSFSQKVSCGDELTREKPSFPVSRVLPIPFPF